MSTKLNPYINFTDSTRQAMEFYKSIFGGELRLSTFKDYHASSDPSEDNNIMHADLISEDGVNFMAADTPKAMDFHRGTTFSMSLTGDPEDGEKLTGFFNKLSAGGQVTQPLAKAPWGDTFGMCTDKFGITWFVNITAPKA